ncbi:NAD-dependent epimerase [Staphylococcus simulans]|uniref:NAD-dependent epimerase n=1 Tax=Staphylococcus simulans UMC-CNS-990 TaxID=1405498 RepID=A0ABP2YTA1_STASI|nr:NAD-dependent epimerase [Staphylococcus simulans]ERS93277.1 NAD-dependent epimerase [Staphylococcus simulans UMC-CNS-990]MCE5149348.1 NAD-dependent epimerase [Staphylococcus simulans]MDQ7111900.1 NAD-dependent epimerase [Staphylococcus simulans]MDQ7117511.1 NAD-dependent epimerase [Staphylococcus simulans]PTJ32476.1 NAD-dependent epimerase [Staphylococcus simulans]
MKVLITGAAGFIGSHLAKRLISQGHEIIGVDNINDYYDPKLKEDRLKSIGDNNFTFYKITLEDADKLEEIFKEQHPDVVVNLAAQAGVRYSLENPRAYIDSNIVGFVNILECCRHYDVKHLIYASSSSVYGANTSKPFSTSDNIDHPLSLYAATKKSNELMAHTYSHLYNLPTTGLRFFTVYGPWGRPDMALFKFTKAIVNDETIDVYNHGNMMRDFTYVDDIVEAISRLVKRPAQPNPEWSGANPDPSSSYAPYKIYNIGNNSPVRLMEFVEAIENKLNKTAKKNYMDLQPGDVPETYANVDDLFRDIDFKPETTIQDGVNNFIDWYLDYYSVNRG